MENKKLICELLCITLQATSNAHDLKSITYDAENETAIVEFEGGIKNINVAVDSGTAMIRDIMNHLGC